MSFLALVDVAKDIVSALCPDDSQWYPGTIEKINDDSGLIEQMDISNRMVGGLIGSEWIGILG